MDDKAAVRKAGLQLLEALLMMRAQGAGGADPELPTEQDIRALEAATADALVWITQLLHLGVCHCKVIHYHERTCSIFCMQSFMLASCCVKLWGPFFLCTLAKSIQA